MCSSTQVTITLVSSAAHTYNNNNNYNKNNNNNNNNNDDDDGGRISVVSESEFKSEDPGFDPLAGWDA